MNSSGESGDIINPKALKYSSNSYFMGLSGTVAKIL